MNPIGTALWVGAAAISGTLAWRQWRRRQLDSLRHVQAREVDRWEGEGGNVPDVAIDAGNQAAGTHGPAPLREREVA